MNVILVEWQPKRLKKKPEKKFLPGIIIIKMTIIIKKKNYEAISQSLPPSSASSVMIMSYLPTDGSGPGLSADIARRQAPWFFFRLHWLNTGDARVQAKTWRAPFSKITHTHTHTNTHIYIDKLEWQKDLQQTSSHVVLFNTDVSPFGLLQCIYKIKTWIA